jgi:hypothetical protein
MRCEASLRIAVATPNYDYEDKERLSGNAVSIGPTGHRSLHGSTPRIFAAPAGTARTFITPPLRPQSSHCPGFCQVNRLTDCHTGCSGEEVRIAFDVAFGADAVRWRNDSEALQPA